VAHAVTGLDGLDAVAAAQAVGAPRVMHFERTASTMDEAHKLAEAGAPSGTIVVADEQLAGRGRLGRRWSSGADAGLWVTTIHRGVPVSALDVLSIRIGIALAIALDPFAGERVSVKWPNDLYLAGGKLAGVLVEARWRDIAIEWVAVGVGINLKAPLDRGDAASLKPGTRRIDVLRAIFPAVRAACLLPGDLSGGELATFTERDAARDAPLVEPAMGFARGITAGGALVVETRSGRELFRRGSLVRASEAG
jgi:BirA family biotin operon repressor/biotin-[acetyl-CoA-carboxylase] ligase